MPYPPLSPSELYRLQSHATAEFQRQHPIRNVSVSPYTMLRLVAELLEMRERARLGGAEMQK